VNLKTSRVTARQVWGTLCLVSPSDDFYALLSNLLHQTAHSPESPPVIPLKGWPAGSPEQLLLEDLQAAVAALQTSNQNQTSQVKEREWQYQSVFETASDGLIINDLGIDLVVEANPAACTMYGYSREEIIGMHPTRFIHPDSHEAFRAYIQAVQSKGRFEAQQVHLHRDGALFYVELHGTAFPYQGKPSLLSVVHDVSQRVHAERLLQQRVETRTCEQAALSAGADAFISKGETSEQVVERLRAAIGSLSS